MHYALRILMSALLIVVSASQLDSKSKKVDPCSYTQTKDGVTLSFATVSKEECKKCFGAINKKYLPLKIQVSPKDKHILLTSDQLGTRILTRNDIISYLNYSSWSIFLPIFFGAGTLLIGPWLGYIIGAYLATASGSIIVGFYGGTLPIMCGTAATITSSQWTAQDVGSMCHLILSHEDALEVAPNTQETRYIFTKTKNFKPEFKVSILDKSTQKNIDFDVHMKSECALQN